jgi:peptide/nickel transport system permease protein
VANYMLRRLLQAIVTIFAVVSITFVFGRIAGNPAAQMLPENASDEQIKALSDELGFNRPYLEQYVDYLGGILHGDFQDSYRVAGSSSMSLVLDRLPSSLYLGVVGFALGLLLAFIAVVVMQRTRNRWLRSFFLAVGSLRASIPDFFFGLILVLLFSVQLGLLPSLGNALPQSVLMPALTIATAQFVVYMRLLDSSMTGENETDYVRTANAKGESPRFVMLREVLPNAVLPVLTVAGMNLGMFLGGLVLIENVFAWPGLGQLIVNSVHARDFPVVQSGLIMVALLFVAANMLVDLIQAALDPRVRLS